MRRIPRAIHGKASAAVGSWQARAGGGGVGVSGLQEFGGAANGCRVRGRDHARRLVQPSGEVMGDLGTQGASTRQEDPAVESVDGERGAVLVEHRGEH